MTKKTLTGTIKIVAGGHKNTGFRDSNGNWHGEWFKATIGELVDLGEGKSEYHSYEWTNMDTSEFEALANALIGTTFKVTLTSRLRTLDDGTMTEDVTVGEKSGIIYHKMNLEDIDIAKEGKIKRGKYIQYIADVKPPEDAKGSAESEDDEDDEVSK